MSNLFITFKERKYFYIFFILTISIVSIYWIAYFPACMSPDSDAQWWEAHHLQFLTDGHPAIYTLFIRLLSFLWDSPGILILFNVILYSWLLSSALFYFYKKGIRISVLLVVLVLFTIVPTNGRMLVTFWKDTTYALGLFWLCFIIIKIVLDREIFVKQNKLYIELFAASFLLLNSRHNGIMVVIPIILTLIPFFKGHYKRFLFTAGMISFSILMVKYIALYVFNAKESWYTIDHAAARHLGTYWTEGKLTTEEKKILSEVMPDSIWVNQYSPWTHDGYAFGPNGHFYRENVKTHKKKIRSIFFKKVFENPRTFIQSEANITQLMWRPIRAEGSYLNTYCKTCGSGLNQDIRKLLDRITIVSDSIEKPFYLYYIFWSGTQFILLYIFLFTLLILRRDYASLVVFVPDLLNCFSLAIAITAQELRYVYSSIIIFPLIILFLIIRFSIFKKLFFST